MQLPDALLVEIFLFLVELVFPRISASHKARAAQLLMKLHPEQPPHGQKLLLLLLMLLLIGGLIIRRQVTCPMGGLGVLYRKIGMIIKTLVLEVPRSILNIVLPIECLLQLRSHGSIFA